jgi:hypothetical protein
MFTPRYQNKGQNVIKIANKSIKSVAIELRYFEGTVINQKYVHEQINTKLNSETANCG